MISDIYKYHPFQSSYFNKLVSNQLKKKFEIDTQSLSRVHAVKEILNLSPPIGTVGDLISLTKKPLSLRNF